VAIIAIATAVFLCMYKYHAHKNAWLNPKQVF
jgi:hypothetical protein